MEHLPHSCANERKSHGCAYTICSRSCRTIGIIGNLRVGIVGRNMPHPSWSVRDKRRGVVDAMVPSGHLCIRLRQDSLQLLDYTVPRRCADGAHSEPGLEGRWWEAQQNKLLLVYVLVTR